jgi:hypothetical protein
MHIRLDLLTKACQLRLPLGLVGRERHLLVNVELDAGVRAKPERLSAAARDLVEVQQVVPNRLQHGRAKQLVVEEAARRDVHEARPVHGLAAHGLGKRRAEQRVGQRQAEARRARILVVLLHRDARVGRRAVA